MAGFIMRLNECSIWFMSNVKKVLKMKEKRNFHYLQKFDYFNIIIFQYWLSTNTQETVNYRSPSFHYCTTCLDCTVYSKTRNILMLKKLTLISCFENQFSRMVENGMFPLDMAMEYMRRNSTKLLINLVWQILWRLRVSYKKYHTLVLPSVFGHIWGS